MIAGTPSYIAPEAWRGTAKKGAETRALNARTPEIAMAVRKVASGQGLQDADAAEWVQ